MKHLIIALGLVSAFGLNQSFAAGSTDGAGKHINFYDSTSTDPKTAGKDTSGSQSTGKDTSGSQSTGKDTSGSQSTGKDTSGSQSTQVRVR